MTPVVVAPNQEAAGRGHRDVRPAQPCATRDSAQIKFTEHVGQGVFALSAICAGDGACVRAIGILGSLETETVAPQIQWPAPNSQSAAARFRSVIPAKLLPSGRWTAGSVLPFWRCFRLFILRAVKVARHLFSCLHSALAVRQDTACQGSNPVRSFSCAVFHDRNTTTGLRAWRAEKPSLLSRNWGRRS
jgi:hypothetical protein